jgi:uncharacterized protein YigE (DUF2233 family)
MSATNRINRRRALACAAAAALAACGAEDRLRPLITSVPVPTLRPTNVPPAPAPPAAADPTAVALEVDSGWLGGDAGVELRRTFAMIGDLAAQAPIILARIDPRRVPLRVRYDATRPRALRSWFAGEQPQLAVNAGYFNADYTSSALVVSDGVVSGTSYDGFGGMLAVHSDGAIELRPLRDTPYDAGEPLAHATQSSPMLVFPGGVRAEIRESGERARRTAVALDQDGQLIFVIAPTSALTLGDLAGWLTQSDLRVDRALNLDGGSSTGLFIRSGPLSETIDAFSPLPLVILAG